MNTLNTIEIQQIIKILPHSYPFLLVDRVVDWESRKYLQAIKNVTYNEPFFQGHFPSKPVFPGVLILEALAQATGILAFKSDKPLGENQLYFFAGIDNARFKRPVFPGDQLVLRVELIKERRSVARFAGSAAVDGEVVCDAQMMCARREVAF